MKRHQKSPFSAAVLAMALYTQPPWPAGDVAGRSAKAAEEPKARNGEGASHAFVRNSSICQSLTPGLDGHGESDAPGGSAPSWARRPSHSLIGSSRRSRAVPERACAALRKVPIWLGVDDGHAPCSEYHPSTEWLKSHGYNPDKAKGVEIGNATRFLEWSVDQPAMVLHELAHAYHDRVLGFDDPRHPGRLPNGDRRPPLRSGPAPIGGRSKGLTPWSIRRSTSPRGPRHTSAGTTSTRSIAASWNCTTPSCSRS